MLAAVAVALLLATLAFQASGCLALLRAGALESRGLPEDARSLARRGGLKTGGASVAASLASLFLALVLGPFGRGASSPAIVAALAGLLFCVPLSGFAGLLAGLSRKPRPSGGLASALLVGALVALAFVLLLS